MKAVRYSYGITAALLAGGAAISLATGFPAGAQVAQNEDIRIQNAVPIPGAPASFADLTQILQPAVVNISTRQRITVANNPFQGTPFADLFGRQGTPTTREAQSLGSGFIVSADGYVVTNNHVVSPDQRAELQQVTVTMPDGTEYPAEVVGRDPQSDLAVLKISRREPFPFVKFGDSSQARVGDWVIAIGNPFGLGGTVTSGIVSAVLRSTGMSQGAYDRYIQTDASINRGNSGGPLFDMQGNVIGINNAIFSPSGGSVGIGFAIPAEDAAPIVQSLISGQEIVRGYIGVRPQDMNEDLAAALGVASNRGSFIQGVQPGEPAERAGLQAGDVVLEVNNEEVTPQRSLSYIVANIRPGTTVPLRIIRDGQQRTINVTVGRRPSEEELAAQSFDPDQEMPSMSPQGGGVVEQALGLQAVPLTPGISRQFGLSSGTQGLVIAAVDPSSDAARKGLERGFIIERANGVAVASVADLEAQIRQARSAGREAVLLLVRPRNGPSQSIPVRLRSN